MSFFAPGAWGGAVRLYPEVYPTQVRATGMGTASGMTRIAGALAPLVGGLLLPVSLTAALTGYAGAFLAGGLAVLAVQAETRGRPLADTAGQSSGTTTPSPRQ